MMPTLDLSQVARGLPTKPGVYLFKDARGTVVYVGKATSLRSRVRSYFAAEGDLKSIQIRKRATDLEYIVTTTQAEALILENTLIKAHKPRLNVRLKDDKTYPYLKIDVREPWPRVYITRRMEDDGSRYFGPYASASSVRKTLDLLNKLFPFRSCTKEITGTDPRPCLDFHINRCLGPCIGAVATEEYRHTVDQAILFLEGKEKVVIRDIKQKMWDAAGSQQYERATFFRDQLSAIEKVTEEQKVVSTRLVDEDVIAFARAANEAWAEVFFIRGGRLLGRDSFLLEGVLDEADGDVLASFVKQFYTSSPVVPSRILTETPINDGEAIVEWLAERRGGGRVQLVVPQRGEKRRLIQMVAQNALQGLEALRVKVLATEDATQRAMEELKEQLNLPRLPERIECYDISNTQGTNSVGSMVVFKDGQPQRAHYRRFRIKTVEGANDFASMQEVLRRRFKRSGAVGQAAEEYASNKEQAAEAISAFLKERNDTSKAGDERAGKNDSFGVLPDLVLIDGGKGQLNAAAEVMRVELGLHHIPLASLAKQQEELFVPDVPESIMLPRTSPALYLVQRARDEAHRFAISYHRNLRQKTGMESVMDIVPGIGPKRKKMLMRHFGSVQKIRDASTDEIAAVPGMTRRLAEKMKEYV
jgi:excinuclease ABC subunit C